MWDVVRPILKGSADDKPERVRAALAMMEAAFPKPEGKGDEKPKAKEPAGAAKAE